MHHRVYEHEAAKFTSVNLRDALPHMGTGDILMHHGTSSTSVKMEVVMHSFFSHTAMVIRDPPADLLELYAATDDASDGPDRGIFVFESTTIVNGTRLTPIRTWALRERARNGEFYCLVWRRLERGLPGPHFSDTPPAFSQMMRTARTVPYEQSKSQLFKAVAGKNRTEDLSSVFCSELVAWALQEMALLPQSENASNWTTTSFSAVYGGDQLNAVAAALARWAPEQMLVIDTSSPGFVLPTIAPP
eukprot:TRINITY_DN5246_c0_g1_i1.p1 TRINITY_DN5246_c0_g1~~TRINITY_DN5246_c0_g1_i1.p1  ORF type:complete len:246 (+),score=31.32 TRINITY_DN5246_c0_g1_i1:31-768(+)